MILFVPEVLKEWRNEALRSYLSWLGGGFKDFSFYPYLGQSSNFDEHINFSNGLELPTRLHIHDTPTPFPHSLLSTSHNNCHSLHQDQALGPQQILAMLSGQAMCYLCVGPWMASNMIFFVTFLLGLIMLTQPGWPTDLNFLGITYLVGKHKFKLLFHGPLAEQECNLMQLEFKHNMIRSSCFLFLQGNKNALWTMIKFDSDFQLASCVHVPTTILPSKMSVHEVVGDRVWHESP